MKVYGFDESKCKEEVVGKNTDIYTVEEYLPEVGKLASDGVIDIVKSDTGLDTTNCVCLGITLDISSTDSEKNGYYFLDSKCLQLAVDVYSDKEDALHIVLKNTTKSDIELSGLVKVIFLKYA